MNYASHYKTRSCYANQHLISLEMYVLLAARAAPRERLAKQGNYNCDHADAWADSHLKCARYIDQELVNACFSQDTEEVKRLITAGAPVDWQNKNGRAPLHYESKIGNRETVLLLIQSKAKVNITDMFGDTPLILAARADRLETVRELVRAGAYTRIRGKKNKTACMWAREYKRDSVADYLTQDALLEQVCSCRHTRAAPMAISLWESLATYVARAVDIFSCFGCSYLVM